MSNPNKIKGDAFERAVQDYLQANGFPWTEKTRASAFELLDASPGHAERLGDLAVGHRPAHFPDRLPFEQRQLGSKRGGFLNGGVDGSHSLGEVGDGAEGFEIRHDATVYPLLANVQGNLYALTMANTRICSRPDCGEPHHGQGLCNTHWAAAHRRGDMPPAPRLTVQQRFEAKVDRSAGPDGCHLWTGSTTSTGYGQFNGGEGNKAHRYAFRWGNGPLRKGEVVRHTCDVPLCVNPRHLVRGSQKQNVQDAIERGRHVPISLDSIQGVRNVNAKLTEESVRQMREEYAAGGVTARELASRYGVSQVAASSAIRRATWSHVA